MYDMYLATQCECLLCEFCDFATYLKTVSVIFYCSLVAG